MDPIWNEIDWDWGIADAPGAVELENATYLLIEAKKLGLMPDETWRGYWPTVVFWWDIDESGIEVEVESNAYVLRDFSVNHPKDSIDYLRDFTVADLDCLENLFTRVEVLLGRSK